MLNIHQGSKPTAIVRRLAGLVPDDLHATIFRDGRLEISFYGPDGDVHMEVLDQGGGRASAAAWGGPEFREVSPAGVDPAGWFTETVIPFIRSHRGSKP